MKMKLTCGYLFPLLLIFCQSANAADKPSSGQFTQPQGLTYGIGLAVKREIYKGYDQRFIPLPLVGYRGEKLSIVGPFISYQVYQNSNWRLSALISPRFEGFDESDSDYFKGMEDREFSMDAGLAINYKRESWTFSSRFRADALSRSNGIETNFKIGKQYRYGPVAIEPNIELTYLDDNNVDYYYGVRASEATAERAFYQAESALNKSLGLTISSPLWGGFIRGNINNTWYDTSITDSPLTERDTSLGIMISYSSFFK